MTDTPAKPLTADEIACFKTNIDTQTIWYVRRESDIPDQYTYSECSGMPDIDRLIATIEQRDKELAAIKETAGKVLDAYMALSKSLDEVGNALRGEKP